MALPPMPPPALFGLHEAGDGVFSPREVRLVRQAAIWPSHPPHAGMSRIAHEFGLARTQAASAPRAFDLVEHPPRRHALGDPIVDFRFELRCCVHSESASDNSVKKSTPMESSYGP